MHLFLTCAEEVTLTLDVLLLVQGDENPPEILRSSPLPAMDPEAACVFQMGQPAVVMALVAK